jgi:hypothetical protein
MKREISMTELEELIKDKFRKNGVLDMIGEDKISEIKEKVKSIIRSKKLEEADTQPAQPAQPAQQAPAPPTPVAQTQNPNVTVKTTEDPEKIEIVKKETELEIKQRELDEKEAKLKQREMELEQKEKELSYKPELPEKLKEVGAGEIIVFSENELSAGMENLSERKFRLKENPDDKVSPHELWLKDTITRSNVYLVELKPIGQLVFDPYNGTTTIEMTTGGIEVPAAIQDNKPENNVDSAIGSQQPKEEMLDMVEPIRDVIQPIVNAGPPEPAANTEHTNFKEMIAKIVQDELTRQNNYSLGPGPAGQGVY